jgi:integrase
MRKKKGRYYARFYDKWRSPKRKEIPLRTTRKDVARRRLTKLEKEWENGIFDPWNPDAGGEALSLDAAVDKFLESREHLRPDSQKGYTSALKTLKNRLPASIMLRDVSSGHLKPIIHDKGVSKRTKKRIKPGTQAFRHRHLRTFFNWAVKSNLLPTSPLDDVTPPKTGRRVAEYLTPKQLEGLLHCIDRDVKLKRQKNQVRGRQVVWLKDLILLAVNTGMRIGELCGLRWRDVDLNEGFLAVRNYDDGDRDAFLTKSGQERVVPIVPQVREVLEGIAERCGRSGYVLRGAQGGRLNKQYASKRFKHYVKEEELPENITFHSLRHTCASWMVQRGVPLAMVQAILGHSDIQVTQKYAHHAPGALKEAMHQALA